MLPIVFNYRHAFHILWQQYPQTTTTHHSSPQVLTPFVSSIIIYRRVQLNSSRLNQLGLTYIFLALIQQIYHQEEANFPLKEIQGNCYVWKAQFDICKHKEVMYISPLGKLILIEGSYNILV